MSALTGSCLCGEIAFSCQSDKRSGAYCHCRNCQKAYAGGGYYLVLPSCDSFELTKGQLQRYTDAETVSGRTVVRCFCGKCGTVIMGKITRNETVAAVVNIAALDQASEFKPLAEFFVDRALPGLLLSDKTECPLTKTSDEYEAL